MAKGRAGPGADKRNRLTDAAVELAYRRGYEASTIADIAAEASVPVGNVYYYFKTKDEIGAAIIERRLGEFAAMRDQLERLDDPRGRLLAVVQNTLDNRGMLAERGCPVSVLSAEFLHLGGDLAGQSRSLQGLPLEWLARQFELMGKGPDSFGLAVHLLSALRGVSLLAHNLGDARVVEIEAAHLKAWLTAL